MLQFFKQIGFTTFIGIIAGILTSVSMLPQLIKTIKKKKSEEISVFMLVILNLGIGTWIYYGVLKNDGPILFTNSFSFLINLTLLIFHFKYKK